MTLFSLESIIIFIKKFILDWGCIQMGTFKYYDSTQLTEHFNIKEFRCKCGRLHDTWISEKLVEKLEQLYSRLDCGKIIITSGYRCALHDKAVGAVVWVSTY